jgi:SAM-dependent methyltransferase
MSTEFTPAQYSEAYGPGVENDFWHLCRNRVILSYIRRLNRGRVLDVGCGRGILVDYLFRHGVDCFGVELGQPSVPERLGTRLFCGRASGELPPEFRASVEVVVLADVVEHLPDPAGFLKDLLSDFPRVSDLIVTVPARLELWSNYDEHYGHYRRYDLDSLERLLKSASVEVMRRSYMFRLLYPVVRLMLVVRGKRETLIRPPRRLLLHRLAAALSYLDFTFLPGFVYGTSAICTARREVAAKGGTSP